MIQRILFVMAGGAIGAAARYLTSHTINTAYPGTVVSHWGTLFVNLVGSFFIGIIFEIVSTWPNLSHLWMFFAVGMLGAFTTFSSYALETHNQLKAGLFTEALFSFLLNNIGCITLVFLGIGFVKIVKQVF